MDAPASVDPLWGPFHLATAREPILQNKSVADAMGHHGTGLGTGLGYI